MFRSWYATCPRGAEDALELELKSLGAKGVRPGQGGVRFTGERSVALRACLELRTALRVLEPVGEFPATTGDELYAGALTLDWADIVAKGQTLAVAASGRAEGLTNTHFVEQRLKDAVVDFLGGLPWRNSHQAAVQPGVMADGVALGRYPAHQVLVF